jgi:mycothiol synthase
MVVIEVRAGDGAVAGEVGDLLAAVERARGVPPLGEQKLLQLRAGARGATAILARDGARVVGYGHLRWNPRGEVPRATVEVAAPDPDLGGRLLDVAREQVAAAGGGTLYVWEHHVDDPTGTVAARAGFRVQRRLAIMVRSLDAPVPDPAPPAGVAVRGFRPGVDDAAFLAVNDRAFAGHPEQGGLTPDDLAERTGAGWFDPAGLLLAWRGDELLGFHWTKVEGDVGEVYVLGIDPSAQGLGLGRALLRAGLAHLAARGCREVVLYVDAANPGALGLYTAEGFTTRSLEVCYEDEVPSASSATSATTR